MKRYPFSRSLAALLLVLIGHTAACVAAAADTSPRFIVPRDEVLAKVKMIGLMPIDLQYDVPGAVAVAQRLESEVTARLKASGFGVVPSLYYTEISDRAIAALGGLYDPMTGAVLRDRMNAFRQYTRTEYDLKQHVDAFLNVAVVVRQVRSASGTADWDGVSESTTGKTGVMGFMEGGSASGRVPALSLYVRLTGLDGKSLYMATGGLQLLEYYGRTKSETGVELRRIELNFIMTDPVRDERAFAIALDPLIRGADAAAAAKRATNPAVIPETPAIPRMTRAVLLARHPRLALAPIDLPALEQHDQVAARYRDVLAARLAKLGFEVAGSADYGALLNDERARVGGFHDVFTARLDPAKVKAARSRVLDALREKYGVTAVVLAAVEPQRAPLRYGRAEWDGASEPVSNSKSMLASAFGGSGDYVGVLNALSLAVHIVDAEGESLFDGTGGIQLAEKLSSGHAAAIPQPELFADPANDVRAVEIALRDLAPPMAPKH